MSLQILQCEADVTAARVELDRRGLSCLRVRMPREGLLGSLFGLSHMEVMGDVRKSWDVLGMAHLIEQGVPRDARVLDIGAFKSEILPVLHALGYRALTGLDLNPRTVSMPNGESINWRVGNFLTSGLAAGSVDVITALSVIEHDYDGDRLMSEVGRLLAPGGLFVASFDYWPEKIATDGMRIFDMTWRIFSRDDVRAMLSDAARHGLEPVGPLSFEAGEPTVHYADREYTFALITLRKRAA